jgi:hypothetical protein
VGGSLGMLIDEKNTNTDFSVSSSNTNQVYKTYELQVSTDLSDANGWKFVQEISSPTNVTLPISGNIGFYRIVEKVNSP